MTFTQSIHEFMPMAACVGVLEVRGVAVLRGLGAMRRVVQSVYENLGFRALVSTPRGSLRAGLARFSLQTKEKTPSGICQFRWMVCFHAYCSVCGSVRGPGCGCASRAGSHASGGAKCVRESGFSGSGVHAARKPTSWFGSIFTSNQREKAQRNLPVSVDGLFTCLWQRVRER
jgi:hypothetical protein